MEKQSALQFYRDHGEWSDPRTHSGAFDSTESSISAITSTVQGVLVHDYFGAHLYEGAPPEISVASRTTLPISERLPTLHEFNQTALSIARKTERRTVGTCRDFALLACSMLRHHGFPARVRCGFAHYFHPPTFEDHWICEYWNDEAQSWKMADAQLDRAHIRHLSIAFDANDMPKDQFVFPWQVWEEHRNDFSQHEAFGHGEAKGFWFLRVNLARDFLALAKQEVSMWDTWRDQTQNDKKISDEAVAQCAQLATATKLLSTSDDVDATSLHVMVENIRTPHWQT